MKLGEIIVRRYGVSKEEIERALEIQKRTGAYLGQILLSEGVISEKQLLSALAEQTGLPFLEREDLEGRPWNIFELSDGLSSAFLEKQKALLLQFEDTGEVVLLTSDPLNFSLLSYLEEVLSFRLKVFLAEEGLISSIAKSYLTQLEGYKRLEENVEEVDRLREIASEAPVIKYLNQLFILAVENRATDIHIEPYGGQFRVRFRVDGLLHEVDTLERGLYLAVVSRIKLLAGLDIAEKRLPQDGKIALRIASAFLDLRVSTIPLVDGESVVIRLLYKERLSFDISSLGLEEDHREQLLSLTSQPYGMILITGPTGSGKTTTLYSLLTLLNTKERKIITVEDPVEYQLEGINQIQVKTEIGYTFAQALRAILRHDPDVIMIGEIRDKETAEIAIHSALTGHLVLSTLHTNDAPSGLFRLVEMGLEDYLLNASIIGLVAQRIVRRICPYCAEPVEAKGIIEHYQLEPLIERFRYLLPEEEIQPMRGKGCKRCLNRGYLGRVAIFELFRYEDYLKEIFVKEKSLEVMRRILQERYAFRTLREDGFIKVLKGITTPEEVLRVA